ncbi:MAG: SurA N-terminal domain-containing protein [Desulfobacteraceae bacterium]|nr:SurA N-terminal domain-containing protein [Desulfobacteraceae bacterium]
MLDFVRKHAKSWLVKVALWIIVIVFVGWGGYTYQSRHETDVALVGDHYITVGEYNNSYNNMIEAYRRQFGAAFTDDLARRLNVRQQALEALIERYLIMKGAQQLGLAATTDEVRQKILQIPVFVSEGRFDTKRYEGILRQMRMTPEMFEQQMAEELTAMKIQSFVKRRAVVTEEEIQADHHFNRDQIKVDYVLFDPKSYEDRVEINDAAVQKFYNDNQNRYMEPEKREVTYVLLNTEEMARDIPLREGEAKAYYDDNIRQYEHEKEVRARHILFRVLPDAPQAEIDKIRANAQKVLDEVKGGKDFAELAKKNSQDEGSAPKGGDLGFFTAKQMQVAFSEAAFALKPGDISDLVRTPYGFHIIKVEEVRPPRTSPLEEVKADIEKAIKLQKAQDLAYAKVRDLRDLAYARKDLAKAAGELKLQVTGQTWLELNQDESESGPFPKQATAKIFELGQADISDIIESPQGLALAQLKTIKRTQAFPFDGVKDKVTKDYRADQAKVLAAKKAAEVLALAKEKGNLADAAKSQNLSNRQTDFFSRQDPDKDLKLLRGESLGKLFDLQQTRQFPDAPLELGNRYVICQFQGQNPAGAPTAEESTEISSRILRQKQSALWEAWLGDMKRNTKIEKFKDI